MRIQRAAICGVCVAGGGRADLEEAEEEREKPDQPNVEDAEVTLRRLIGLVLCSFARCAAGKYM